MPSYFARVERTHGKSLNQVQVFIRVDEGSSGRPSWSGGFSSRSADGFLPSERIELTLNNGQKGSASVSRTVLDSRTPDETLVEFTGSGPLA
jgi:hypothetical protein